MIILFPTNQIFFITLPQLQPQPSISSKKISPLHIRTIFYCVSIVYNIIRSKMVKVINNYTLIEKIGQGNFGDVYRALNVQKKGEFAVKVISAEKFQYNSLLEECTVNEIKTLSTIGSSEFIVKYEDHFQTKNNYYFVYQYCNGGNLMDAIKKEGHFAEKKALRIFRELLEAFKVLNRFNIMHRDIKPENIFFSNGKVKLGDFGFCKGLEPGEYMAKTMLGSPLYMAPEVLKGEKYSIKADIWSLGVVLYEMLFGDCPFKSNSIAMLIGTISKSELTFPFSINSISETTLLLLKKMLTKDYFRRINWVELFSFKIDEGGNYLDIENTPMSPYISSSKSLSKPKELNVTFEVEDNSISKEQGSVQKPEKKVKFYAEKYMTAFLQPLQFSSKGSQRKISFFEDEVIEKYAAKDETLEGKFYNSERKIDTDFLSIPKSELTKRERLLAKHMQCIVSLKQALEGLETREEEAICSSYVTLNRVQAKLKEITEDIKISETNLLDIASLVNYEIIQVSRQMNETQNEMQRRRLPLSKLDSLLSYKSFQSQILSPEVSPFNISILSTSFD